VFIHQSGQVSVSAVKYVYKGHDRVQAQIVARENEPMSRDEPQRYLDGRYVSASEAYWRICEFSLQQMYPSVYSLQVHTEDDQLAYFNEGEYHQTILDRANRNTLTEWMRYNREHPEQKLHDGRCIVTFQAITRGIKG
jgi:hypothetical protein